MKVERVGRVGEEYEVTLRLSRNDVREAGERRKIGEVVREALKEEARPEELMSKRDREVVGELLKCSSNKEIGEVLGITERTVKAHLGKLYGRFGIMTGDRRVKLAVMCFRRERTEEKVLAAGVGSLPDGL
jgi:DNA-binding NarL/FixJ family response regulator